MVDKLEFERVLTGLLATYAYVPTRTPLPIASVDAVSVHEGMTLANFRNMFAPQSMIVVGPNGRERSINPVNLWLNHQTRLTVQGLQLRPDQGERVFVESGKAYINVYTPERFDDDGGDALPGIEFLQHLFPDPIERKWFTQRLAHKYRYPAVPGPAVVLVAREFGTGRGTLGNLVKRLFGGRYVKTIGFDIFAGRNYQSQYNDWAADSLVVLVNESSTSEGGSPYRAKHDTYEHLKDVVDPSPVVRHFIVKGLPAFDAPGFTSYIIATNNPDALPLPEGDRRFWVGTNGSPRGQNTWDKLYAWMEDPVNIGAFARYLEEFDLTGFSPYQPPPMTRGKEAMTQLATSPLDRAFAAAMEALPGRVVVPDQVFHAMEEAREVEEQFPFEWKRVATLILRRQLFRVGKRDGQNYQIRFGEQKHSLYARSQEEADTWTVKPAANLRNEVLRNGAPSSGDISAALSKLVGRRNNGQQTLADSGSPPPAHIEPVVIHASD